MSSEKTVSKIDFESRLQELSASDDPTAFAELQMLILAKFALDTGVLTEDEYSHWRMIAKSL